MKEYEVACTYLNGCAGAAYPQTSFEEIEAESPEAYLKKKHGKDFVKFCREEGRDGRTVYAMREVITFIYEFTEL
jgi:hypothetical protein